MLRDASMRKDLPVAVTFRQPCAEDGASMWRLVKQMGTLELNSAYFYVLFARDFSGTSVVSETGDGQLAGFVVGRHPPARPDSVFVWQIGVAPWMRRQGLAQRMLEALVTQQSDDVQWLEATVSPDNAPSMGLFRSFARAHELECVESDYLGAELFPGAHEPERLFRIGPLKTSRADKRIQSIQSKEAALT